MLICAGIGVGWYIGYRMTDFKVDMMPLSYIILLVGAVVPVYHSNLYTVNENNDIIIELINKVGFLTFNANMEYMGANEYALAIIDELRDCEVGRKIIQPGSELAEMLASLGKFRETAEGKPGHVHAVINKVHIKEQFYDVEIHTLENFWGKCAGYTLQITDETDHYRMLELTERYNEELTGEVEAKTERILSIQEKTILGMAQVVESRDRSTGGHVKRTSDVVRIFAKKLLEQNLGFDKNFLDLVVRSAPMHDIGKIGVDDAVLRKQGKYTGEEYDSMKKHAEIGGKMIKDILTGVEEEEFVQVAYHVANYHHEKVNGSGYPSGLVGEQIPVEARIMALADVFDALVSKRCYKEPFSYDESFAIIQKDAGEHFDRQLAELFLQCKEELIAYYDNN